MLSFVEHLKAEFKNIKMGPFIKIYLNENLFTLLKAKQGNKHLLCA